MDVVVRCLCREPYNDGKLVQCEKCGFWQHLMCVGQSPGPCFKCSKEDERNKMRTRKRQITEGVPASLIGKRRASGIADHPECFNNEISANEFAEGVFGRDLTEDEAPPAFGIEIKRISHTYSMAAFGLFTLEPVSRGDYCAEVIGQVDWVANYKANTFNQYKLMGCPKPGVLFSENMAIDCRVRGNYGAFVQHSSHPNCRVTAINQDKRIRFLLQALQDLEPDTKLTVAWQWDAKHPIRKPLHTLSPAQSTTIEKSLNRLREFGLVGSVSEFLPEQGSEPELHRPRPSGSAKAKAKPKTANPADEENSPHVVSAPSTPGAPLATPLAQFVWTTPQLQPVEEAPKKRLSLADYKKKRPVTESG